MYKMQAEHTGCPSMAAANTRLIQKTFAVSTTSLVVVTGRMIRSYAGRADLQLFVDNSNKDVAITYTSSTQWEEASVS